MVFILFRALHPVKWIDLYQAIFERLIERPPHDGVVVDHRVSDHSLCEQRIVEIIRPLAKLGKAVEIADASDQGKAKGKAAPAIAVRL